MGWNLGGRALACVLTVMASLLMVAGVQQPASAAAVFVSTSATPGWQVDGVVYSTLIVGDTVYVGGVFKNAVAPDGTLVPRNNLAAFSVSTGALVTSFRADAASTVRAFATDGSSLYVGGAFLSLGGVARTYVGKVNLVTGAVAPGFAPVPDDSVRALLYSGGRLYVGGNFTHLNTGIRGHVARMDPSTGVVDTTFAANVNNSVYALRMSPSGDRLYIGGNYGTINGVARNGMGAVNPADGSLAGIVFASSAKPTFAISTNEDGSTVFASGGSATNATGAWDATTGVRKWRVVTDGDNQAMVYYRGVVYFGFHDGYQGNTSLRLLAADAQTGAVDPSFRPTFDQFWGVWAIDVSAAGLVVGGDFTSAGGLPTTGFARFLATSAPPPPPPTSVSLLGPNSSWAYWDKGTRPTGWETSGFDSSTWSRGVPRLGYGDTFDDTIVGFGPSSTNKFITTYFRSSFDLATIPDSLDLEVSADDGAVVYVNGQEVARDSLPAGTVTNTTTALADRSGGAETALTKFPVSTSLLTTGTNTVAVEVHQFSKTSSDMGLDLELDGLYNTPDTTNHSPVAAFTSSMAGMTGSFDATGSSDSDGTVAFYSWDFGDGTSGTGATATHTYTTAGDYRVVLSVLDNAGALDTEVATVTAVSPQQTLIQKGDSWPWRYSATAAPAGWNTPGFDSSAWSRGNAPLGYGDASVITRIDTGFTSVDRPKTAYFTKAVQIANPSKVSQLVINTVADDGVIVYVNGTEVGRTNMPAGAVTLSTSASAPVRTASAAKVTINASPDLLVAGTNVISAETHLNSRSTPDVTFDLTALVTTGNARPTASFTSSSSQLAASFDASASADSDGSVASYDWTFGDGTTGTGVSPSHAYAASGTYPVTLTVTDDDGAIGSVSHSITVVTADPNVVPFGSSWRWRYVASAPPVAWTQQGFDASSWGSGNAVLGFGDASVKTNIDSFVPTSTRPVAAQFVRTFQIADPAAVTALTLSTVADDGVVVYVNGTEVGRSNMPAGTISFNTFASSSRRTATANASPVTLTVPTGLLVAGTNTVAVETHLNSRSTTDATFDLRATVTTAP